MTNQKEKRKVPELRFPEFSGEWEEKKLNNFMYFNNGINASKESYGSGKKFINVLDVLNKDFITYDNIIGKVSVSEKLEALNKVEYGDALFLRSSETRIDVGKANIYLDKDKSALFGGFIIRGKKISDYSPLFMKYLLNNQSTRQQISSKAGGSTRFNVSQSILNDIEIIIPSINEQQKIGEFFSKLDRQIELEEKKLALLEEQKKGYMQKIFSQELRFKDENGEEYPEWEITKLSDLYYKGKAGGTPKSNESRYYNGNINFLSVKDITTQGMYIENTEKTITEAGLENSSAWIVPVNSICYSMYASVGFLSINKIPLATSQAIFSMIFKDIELTKYIYYYLLYFQSLGKIEKLVGTGTQSNLSSKIMANIEILVPINDEYIKINILMDKYYKRIEFSKNKINLLKQRISYLNNNLFI